MIKKKRFYSLQTEPNFFMHERAEQPWDQLKYKPGQQNIIKISVTDMLEN